jgi:hypothetical protein|tara:strand:- start:783 stop:1088 length:306 start_codon:yes stop_codon:yes gene_type:complete
MKLYELIEGRRKSIREIAVSIIERHNRGKPTAFGRRWITELSLNDVFVRSLEKESARYSCIDSSLLHVDGWLDTSSMYSEAINILDRYKAEIELVNSTWRL